MAPESTALGSETEGSDDPLTPIVQEYCRQLDEGRASGVDEFCAGHPAELREELRERCLDVRYLKRVLPGSEEAEPARELDQTFGDFRLLREIARGGMGVVYLARQRSLDREVAVKVLPAHLTRTRKQIDRFQREAHSVARLKHPLIVPVHAIGQEGENHWFAMDFIQGRSLYDELQLLRGEGSESERSTLPHPMSSEYLVTVVRIVQRVAEALDYAHEQGVVHRDVNPRNILLDDEGVPHLIDFGLALDAHMTPLSLSGIDGTPHYMSPEQAVGRRGPADHRVDVFGLGVVLYELLTRARPFEGNTLQEVLHEILHREQKPIREREPRVARDLETVCGKALSKSPEARYRTAGEFAADLRRFLAHEAILARPPSMIDRARRLAVAHRTAAVGTASVGVALVAGFWFAGVRAEEQHLDLQLESLRTLDGDPDWHDREFADILQAEQTLRGLLASRDELPDEAERLVRRVEGRIDHLVEEWSLEGQEDLVLGMAVRLLRPEDEELARIASFSASLPRLTVTSEHVGARVFVRAIDPVGLPGEALELGQTPLRAHPVPPGQYRIVVEVEGLGFAEMTRDLQRGEKPYELNAIVRPSAEVTGAGMVRVAGGGFLFGHDESRAELYEPGELELDEFWIDECEVSNAEYRAFLADTGHEPPNLWPEAWDAAWDDLPVVGVDVFDASAYAEWAGKRLVSHPEWERAARGRSGRLYPWGDDPRTDEPLSNTGRPFVAWTRWSEAFEIYTRAAVPVRSHPEGRTPEGLFHLYGNVEEITENLVVEPIGDEELPLSWTRVLKGGSWSVQPGAFTLGHVSWIVASYRQPDSGFRCAKSVHP